MIAAIENAVIARLIAAAPALGYAYRTTDSYPDQFDEYLKTKTAGLKFPAAWTTFLGFDQFVELEDFKVRGAARFVLVVGSQHVGNETASRHGGGAGAAAQPGSYQLAIDAIGLLTGSNLGLDIDRIRITRAGLIAATPETRKAKISMMAVEFWTMITLPLVIDDADEAGSFEEFHVDWDVPPFGGVGPDLPDDEHADASDLVILEGDDT